MKTHKQYFSKYVMIFTMLTCFAVFFMNGQHAEEVCQPKRHMVTIIKMKFEPANLTIKKGDTVVWVNKDFFQHDVTEVSRKWSSKPMNQGATWSKVINEDVNYFCDLHKVMKGTITITK
ncbi:plastocyanin/azurin family copper-binding protein [uncultured Gelidibacter sp.]|uniref:plastocyanin/azurin family copper-binding protein n=1 Tax=uncultured Gelidibacter sp. TaxID=259318 RepID=UPI00261C0C47|nr:plastocyanin/azurin family copper-binding protein [uncultured Gelidibacter sp.]